MRAVTASKTCVTATVRRGAFCVAATVSRIRSTLPLESLMPMMFGCCASSAMSSIGIWCRDELGNVVEHNRERRAVGDAAEVVEDGCGGNLARIVAGRANEDGVVLEGGRELGQLEGARTLSRPTPAMRTFSGAVAWTEARSTSRVSASLSVDGLAGGAENHHPRQQAARVARHVGLNLAEVDALVWVKRRGDRGEDSFHQHSIYCRTRRGAAARDSLLHSSRLELAVRTVTVYVGIHTARGSCAGGEARLRGRAKHEHIAAQRSKGAEDADARQPGGVVFPALASGAGLMDRADAPRLRGQSVGVPQGVILLLSLAVPLVVGLIVAKIHPSEMATAVWLVGLIWVMIVSLYVLDLPTGPDRCFQCSATEKCCVRSSACPVRAD